ncbi:hypothetical protein QUB63_17570 [Microcoleus sp. ARI1-B5]|uniref:hypothetical protein n=1 Tax=unclassified Microcoleus TaxID=2642155 RepID=UPI002FD0199E
MIGEKKTKNLCGSKNNDEILLVGFFPGLVSNLYIWLGDLLIVEFFDDQLSKILLYNSLDILQVAEICDFIFNRRCRQSNADAFPEERNNACN